MTDILPLSHLQAALELLEPPHGLAAELLALHTRVRSDPSLSAALRQDSLALADPNGPRSLVSGTDTSPASGLALYPALVLLSRTEAARAAYTQRGIPMSVLKDTLSDILLWVRHCERVYGYTGLRQYRWLTRHLRLSLFRLGRLQFAPVRSRCPHQVFRDDRTGVLVVDPKDTAGRTPILLPDMPAIEVHIPEGAPLLPDSVHASLEAASHFFPKPANVFICDSWLLAPCLSRLLPGSNIARFNRRFLALGPAGTDDQMYERLYDIPEGTLPPAPDRLPADTRLRAAMRAHLAAGNHCPKTWGIIVKGSSQH